jgi:hypothetical protein
MNSDYNDNEGWPDYIDPDKATSEWFRASANGSSYYDWDNFRDHVLSNRERFRHLERPSGKPHRGPFSRGYDNDYESEKNYQPQSRLSIPFDERGYRDLSNSLNRIKDPSSNLEDDPESPKTREYVLRMLENHNIEHVYLKLVELQMYQTANWISYNFFNKGNIGESKKNKKRVLKNNNKMKKVIRLTENDLIRVIERIVKEDLGGMDDSHPIYGKMNLKKDLDIKSDSKNPIKKTRKSPLDIEDDFDFEDHFEESELEEMKRKVRVMEDKLRRRKQMRRK